jgi:hypothetical protein
MPALVPFIPLIVGAVGGTVGGLQLADVGTGSPQKDAQAQLTKDQQMQSQADQMAKQKAILASLPNAQEQGGGSLQSPELVNLASIIAGLPGEGNAPNTGGKALSAFLGQGDSASGTGGNLVSSTYGINGSQG